MPLIAHDAVCRLAAAYPDKPAMLRHDLAGEPMLSRAALAAAAAELDPALVERRVHDAQNGEAFTLLGYGLGDSQDAPGAASAIAAAGGAEQWIMLSRIERLARYRALLDRLIGELGDAIIQATGKPDDVKGFVFVSAPGTHTPFHFDAEFNILFQISGTKTFATYPPRAPFLSLAARETYHVNGDNMLGWQSEYADAATLHELAPGDAVFVPHGAPHWVKVGAEPSVSLSLTWQNPWSDRLADALALNPLLRRLGLPVTDPATAGDPPRWRAAASRIAQKAGVL